MRVLVAAYHTPGPYAEEANRLRCSLEELAIPHVIKCVQFDGANQWKQAVSYKPKFVLDTLMSLPVEYQGVLYTDADSIARRPLPLEELAGCDVAWHKFQWTKGHALESLTGTIYLSRDPRVCAFVQAWNANTPKWMGHDTPEQFSLD